MTDAWPNSEFEIPVFTLLSSKPQKALFVENRSFHLSSNCVDKGDASRSRWLFCVFVGVLCMFQAQESRKQVVGVSVPNLGHFNLKLQNSFQHAKRAMRHLGCLRYK